jgi:hypothetical protein
MLFTIVLFSVSVDKAIFGINQAQACRYSDYIMMLSVFALLCNTANFMNLLNIIKLLYIIFAVLVANVLISDRNGFGMGKDRNTKMQIFAAHLEKYENATDE